jgi:hypothetical protein
VCKFIGTKIHRHCLTSGEFFVISDGKFYGSSIDFPVFPQLYLNVSRGLIEYGNDVLSLMCQKALFHTRLWAEEWERLA